MRISLPARQLARTGIVIVAFVIIVLVSDPVAHAEPRERRILYRRLQTSSPYDDAFFISGLDGSSPVLAGQVDGQTTQLGRWSQDGSKMAWTVGSWYPDGYEIYVSDGDGSSGSMHNITNSVGLSESYVLWQPGSDKISYLLEDEGVKGIYSINSDGSNNHLLFNLPSTATYSYSFSPDGTKIVFSNGVEGDSDIYIANSDGSGLTQLNSDASAYSEPVFSPDGTKIVVKYNLTSDYAQSTYRILNADGSPYADLSDVQEMVGVPTSPVWSPDSLSLVFSSTVDIDHRNLFSVVLSSKEVTRLTNRLYSNYPRFFSPDGTKVYFNSTDTPGSDYSYGTYAVELGGDSTEIAYQDGYDIVIDEFALEPEVEGIPGSNNGGGGNSDDGEDGPSPISSLTPRPPRTGVLLGAGLVTVSVLVLILLVTQELESRHLGKERSKNRFH